MTNDGDRLLWLSIEDYSGLWEAVWELRPLHPDLDAEVLREHARRELLRLAEQDLVQFYRSVEPDGDITDIDRQEVARILGEDRNWDEPTAGSVSIRFGATPAGYAAAGVTES